MRSRFFLKFATMACSGFFLLACGSAVETSGSYVGSGGADADSAADQPQYLGSFSFSFDDQTGELSTARLSPNPTGLFTGFIPGGGANALSLTFSDVSIGTDQDRTGGSFPGKLGSSGVWISVNDRTTVYENTYLLEKVTYPSSTLLEATKTIGNDQAVYFGTVGGDSNRDYANVIFSNSSFVSFSVGFDLYGTESRSFDARAPLSRIRSWSQAPLAGFGARSDDGIGSTALRVPADPWDLGFEHLTPLPGGNNDKLALTISGSAGEVISNGYCYTLGEDPTCETPEDAGEPGDNVLLITGKSRYNTEDLTRSKVQFYDRPGGDPVGDEFWLTRFEPAVYTAVGAPCTDDYQLAFFWIAYTDATWNGDYLEPDGAVPSVVLLHGGIGFNLRGGATDYQEWEWLGEFFVGPDVVSFFADCDRDGIMQNDGNTFVYDEQYHVVTGGFGAPFNTQDGDLRIVNTNIRTWHTYTGPPISDDDFIEPPYRQDRTR